MLVIIKDQAPYQAVSALVAGILASVDLNPLEIVTTVAYCVGVAAYVWRTWKRRS